MNAARHRHPVPATRWPTASDAAASLFLSPLRGGATCEVTSRTCRASPSCRACSASRSRRPPSARTGLGFDGVELHYPHAYAADCVTDCEALDQRHQQVTCQLWGRVFGDDEDRSELALSADGKRRLVPPTWDEESSG